MENRLNFSLLLSLKEIALRRIGVAMCNKPSLYIKIVTFDGNQRTLGTSYYSDILDNVSNLWIPESLKKEMIPIIRAVCDEMTRWKFYHDKYFDRDISARFFSNLCWTTEGTVNYQKTAHRFLLSSDELLDPEFRFQLACFYCLEDFIPELWSELPVERKKDFFNGDISQIKEPHLQLFLPKILERAEITHFENFFRYSPRPVLSIKSIELAACLGNKTLFDFYFSKLSKGEKEDTLIRTTTAVLKFQDELTCYAFNVERNLRSTVLLHLLSLLTAEEQMRLFKKRPIEVLGCFLDWPRQDLFLDIADAMWTFLPEKKYKHLFMTLKFGFAYPDNCFRNLFHEFFQRSPVHFRKLFTDGECLSNKCFWLFISGDAETIRVVLRNLDPSDRVKFLFSEGGTFIIYYRQNDRSLLEVFFRELNLTKEEKRRLKEAVIEHARRNRLDRWVKNNFGNFFELLDEWEASAQKRRSSDQATWTEVKRLCMEKEKTPLSNM